MHRLWEGVLLYSPIRCVSKARSPPNTIPQTVHLQADPVTVGSFMAVTPYIGKKVPTPFYVWGLRYTRHYTGVGFGMEIDFNLVLVLLLTLE